MPCSQDVRGDVSVDDIEVVPAADFLHRFNDIHTVAVRVSDVRTSIVSDSTFA